MGKAYYWFWHDLLRMRQDITHTIIGSMTRHEFIWNMAGGLVLTSGWILVVHLIVTRNA